MSQVLDCADFAVIPYVHDPFAITPTRRAAALCADRGVPARILINRVDGRRGSGPLEDAKRRLTASAWRGSGASSASSPRTHRLTSRA